MLTTSCFGLRNLSKLSNNIKMASSKVDAHAQAMKIQRVKIREKNMKYSPGIVNLQVLGSGAKGAPKSLYLFTDQSRYLFNCGEGTQRLAHEHKMKLGKLDSIFITYPVWENLGGLLGLALTIQDVGVPEITLHGPEGLQEIFVGTQRFVVLKNLHVSTKECVAYEKYEDHILSVTYVPVLSNQVQNKIDNGASSSDRTDDNKSPHLSEEDDIDYYDYGHNNKRQHSPNRSPNSPNKSPNSPNDKKRKSTSVLQNGNKKYKIDKQNISMSYICQLKPRPGTLNIQKCVSYNVPPGPLLGQLKSGKDITLADGTIVKSTDVTDPDEVGAVFLIVDCPSLDFLDNFVSEKIFERHQKHVEDENNMAFIIAHFSSADVMSHPKYKEWMRKFPASSHHLILNESNECLGSSAVHRIQCKLNLLDSDIFPMLNDGSIPLLTQEIKDEVSRSSSNSGLLILSKSEISPELEPFVENFTECETSHYNALQNSATSEGFLSDLGTDVSIIHARSLMKIPLRPRLPVDKNPQFHLDIRSYISDTINSEGFPEALEELKNNLQTYSSEEKEYQEYPHVIFLGTGSSIPNKTRNTSGILLRLDESSCMLLDCGEGTYSQLVRLYGKTEVDSIMNQIKGIYVSHLHADHHLGLISLIKARSRLRNDKLYLLAPKQIITWLSLYCSRFENISPFYQLVPLADFIAHGHNRPKLDPETELILHNMNLEHMTTTLVRHCPNAFGVALTTKSGHKITYSGDTMPCDSLVAIGKNSDLLIHEATHEDELAKEAAMKMHSTVSQAIKIGQRMNSKYTVLTHFSQRYAKLPRLNFDTSTNLGIAFDNMKISMTSLDKLKFFYSALKVMFSNEQDEIEHRALKRNLKQEVRKKIADNKL